MRRLMMEQDAAFAGGRRTLLPGTPLIRRGAEDGPARRASTKNTGDGARLDVNPGQAGGGMVDHGPIDCEYSI